MERLNTVTGAVAAVVQWTKVPNQDSGGAGIPIQLAMKEFPEIAELITDPPTAARKWRDALGDSQWQTQGHALQWRRPSTRSYAERAAPGK